jgi:hypothetical protein
LSNALETQEDIPKDDLGLSEPKKGYPQWKIDLSTTDDQVSTEPTLMPLFQSVLKPPMSNRHKPSLQNTRMKFKNLVLNKYIPLEVWGIHSPGEINKSSNPWMK